MYLLNLTTIEAQTAWIGFAGSLMAEMKQNILGLTAVTIILE